MSRALRFSPVSFFLVMLISIGLGFISWTFVVAASFVGGFIYAKNRSTKFPALLAALAVATGWFVTALVRDLLEGARISSRLASFLSLPHATVTYLVLFLICFIPALFASGSGVALNDWLESRAQSRPASGK